MTADELAGLAHKKPSDAPMTKTRSTKWTRFLDMSSGGREKLEWSTILIEAPEDEAVRIFKARFHRDPYNVTCGCCGDDYIISEHDGPTEQPGFSTHIIRAEDIRPEAPEDQFPVGASVKDNTGCDV